MLIIKPLVTATIFHWYDRSGRLLRRTYQSGQNTAWSLFQELVFITNIFPHRNLTIQIPFVTLEDHRLSPRFVSRIRRRRPAVLDVRLSGVEREISLSTARDVLKLFPSNVPALLSTPVMKSFLGISPWQAQQVLYCLRKFGLVRQIGCQNRFRVYQWAIDPYEWAIDPCELPGSAGHVVGGNMRKFSYWRGHSGKLKVRDAQGFRGTGKGSLELSEGDGVIATLGSDAHFGHVTTKIARPYPATIPS